MDKFPVLWNGSAAGELQVERSEGYTDFMVCFRQLPAVGPWCVWVTGEKGALRLGVLEGGCGVLRRRFSRQMTASLGPVCHGELRAAGGVELPWERCERTELPISSDWLRQRLPPSGRPLMRRSAEKTELALRYDPCEPFPLLPLFCFARLCVIGEQRYAVYTFDPEGEPMFPIEKNTKT